MSADSDQQPLRVVFVSWRDSGHPDGGGSEIYIEAVARELARRGHRVVIRCAHYHGAPLAESRDGVALLRRGGRLTVYPRALIWLLRHRRRIDVVVDVVNGLPFASPLVRRHGVVALLHHLHEAQWRLIYPGLGGRLGWFVESRVVPVLYRHTPFLTVSHATAADLGRIGIDRERVSVAHNAVTVADAAPEPESTHPRLCVLSRLVPHKRIEHAFTVIARLRDEVPDLHLDVIGDGWWRDRLEHNAAALGVADAVTFHGRISDVERDRLLGRAWVHLVPSAKEGWCLAVSEAGAQATPSLAYRDGGGVVESIEDGRTGMLVDDLDGLTEATRHLLHDPERRHRLGQAARVKARSQTWGATTDTVEELLRRSRRPLLPGVGQLP